ncbi:hypothetical protein GCM10022243_42210 [Saccharothrix violaceirubra]
MEGEHFGRERVAEKSRPVGRRAGGPEKSTGGPQGRTSGPRTDEWQANRRRKPTRDASRVTACEPEGENSRNRAGRQEAPGQAQPKRPATRSRGARNKPHAGQGDLPGAGWDQDA